MISALPEPRAISLNPTNDNYEDTGANTTTCCSTATNTDSTAYIDYEELSLKVVQELEQWKSQQMQTFINELARKETKFMNEFQQNCQIKQARLEAKIAACDQLNSQLDSMIRDFNEATIKNQEYLKIVEALKHEMESNYEKKFIEIGVQMERLKIEIQEKDKSTDNDNTPSIEAQKENERLRGEAVELKERIKILHQHLAVSQNTNVPIKQLINIISDLVSID